VQVGVGDHPHSEQTAAHLQLPHGVGELVAVVPGEVLQVEAVDAHDNCDGEDVQLQQPEVADDGSAVVLEVLLDGTPPPVAEGHLRPLLAARTGGLGEVGLAGHRASLVQMGEVEVGRVLEGLV
jgi:hypothetical protein